MTSAIGNRTRVSRGFSIIEIILVLGLIALAGSLMIANFASMADRGGKLNTEESLRAAIRQARFDAASERTIVRLSVDKESGSLVLSSGATYPLGPEFSENGQSEIRFYLVPPSRGLSPYSDPEQTKLETTEVLFAPDRSSSPFVVDIYTGNGTPERMVFDPFSSLRRSVE
ncbi:MAG: pilus assembly FimT family protein [Opitutaceae bacterium]